MERRRVLQQQEPQAQQLSEFQLEQNNSRQKDYLGQFLSQKLNLRREDSDQERDVITIPEEGDDCFPPEKQTLFTCYRKQNHLNLAEKIKKYDGVINNKRSRESTNLITNPLLRNKGAIQDDWTLQEMKLAGLKKDSEWGDFKPYLGRVHRVAKSFHQGPSQYNEKQENSEYQILPNSLFNCNSKNEGIGISKKPTQLGFNSRQVSLYPKSSSKNANLSLFQALQSSQQIGTASNNLQMSRVARAPTNMKDSNNRLTLKTLNEQTWDLVMRAESNYQSKMHQQQLMNPSNFYSKELHLQTGPFISQHQLSNFNYYSQYSQEQSASRRQRQDRLSSDRIISQLNPQPIDQEEHKLGNSSVQASPQSKSHRHQAKESVSAKKNKNRQSSQFQPSNNLNDKMAHRIQKAAYMKGHHQSFLTDQQNFQQNFSVQPYLHPNMLSQYGVSQYEDPSINLSKASSRKMAHSAHQICSSQQIPLQTALSQSQLAKQHTNQALCENLIYEENSESSDEEKKRKSIEVENQDEESDYNSQEDLDEMNRKEQGYNPQLSNKAAQHGSIFKASEIFYEDDENNYDEESNSQESIHIWQHPNRAIQIDQSQRSNEEEEAIAQDSLSRFQSYPVDELNLFLERIKSKPILSRNEIIEEVLEDDISQVDEFQNDNLSNNLEQVHQVQDRSFKQNKLVQSEAVFSKIEGNIAKISEDQLGHQEQDQGIQKSKSVFYLRRRKRESLLIAKKQKLQRTKTQVIFTVKSQEIQLNKLSKSYVYLAKGLSEEIQNIDQFSQFGGQASALGTYGAENYNSIFFEKDMNIEQYKQTLKDALAVQFQKEKNISHQAIKKEYDAWVSTFQLKYRKTSSHKKTIVFDLDETLVRAQDQELQNGYDSKIRIIESEKKEFMIYVKLRPGLNKALQALSENFELILFTAASTQYANIVLQTFEGSQYFDHVLSRNQCLFIEQYKVYIKDLQILTLGRDLQNMIIVDNKIESFCSHLENGIPIKSYYGEEQDDRLDHLVTHLIRLKEVADVRQHIMKDFFLKELKSNQVNWQEGKASYQEEVLEDCIDNDRERYKKVKHQMKQRHKSSQIRQQNLSLSSLDQNELEGGTSKEESKEGKFNYTKMGSNNF